MKRVILAVYDSASKLYGQPLFVAATPAGVRSFIDEVRRPGADNAIHNHPADFELRELGLFDDVTGEIEQPALGPTTVMRAKDVDQQS